MLQELPISHVCANELLQVLKCLLPCHINIPARRMVWQTNAKDKINVRALLAAFPYNQTLALAQHHHNIPFINLMKPFVLCWPQKNRISEQRR